MKAKLLIPRARHWIAVTTGAVLLSLLTVASFVAAVGGLGLVLESERLWQHDYLSVNDCLIDTGARRAVSLYWVQPLSGRGWKTQLGMHDLGSRRPNVQTLWPHIQPSCVAASPIDGRLFIGTRDGSIYVASELHSSAVPSLLGQHAEGDAVALACSADGRYLLSLGWHSLQAWSLPRGELVWRRDDVEARCLAIHPSSGSVVCGFFDGRMVEIDCERGCTVRQIAGQSWPVLNISFSPNGRRLASIGGDGELQLWSWPAGTREWHVRDSPNGTGGFRIACFSPCGRFLITAAHEDVRVLVVWNAETGARLGELRGHTNAVLGATFAQDGRLYSWGADGTIRTWDIHDRAALGVVSPAVHSQPG